jgi:hypothetical protein
VFLHLGGDLVVAIADVVAIVDSRLVEHAEVNREFLDRALAGDRIRGEGFTPDCKALVITPQVVYTSGISASTLARRMGQGKRGMISWEGEK